ncbi:MULTISPECIES: MaoC family dehydratase [Haloarcula]|jgi:acyl dehydratase|uniref:Monoamine oxidase n=5 Tax=Haloarcula TaxID=2237 RepID=Q5UWD3_HALMA|nr:MULTISPECIES: MaoC/PaaZ C-terminal domain-containing protein [Haloarcula]AAV48420.1 monoamine oxidase regulatory protein [Haloarcula marismortui ATCC 43049]EMA08891.1 monoamine oxidase regulatory protein [Haloarcula sinaiiensis ATCC 33800]EMA17888.1 monoamine oxidase regulatory protein [Haloarcula argentinensis DSM 12282]EMA21256.1 monoamine oxidase regulatory protein [Haloarcula californiae ATCC 33799]EMA28309.1 monoamine oxidase regulatory protein [Haloarcula japonica DSM 6131]
MAYSYEPHHFEDFEEGQEFISVGRTVTESDFVMHSALSGDWTELHTNKEYAEEQEFGERIAHGPMTFVQATGFVYRTGIVERTAFAFLGMNYMDLPNPVHIGDTLQLEIVVDNTKEVGRDDAGLVVLDTEMENQDGTVVFEGDMKFLIKKRE